MSRKPDEEMGDEWKKARNGDGRSPGGHPSRLVALLREMTEEENGTGVTHGVSRLNHANLKMNFEKGDYVFFTIDEYRQQI